jgi:hypothetical protein
MKKIIILLITSYLISSCKLNNEKKLFYQVDLNSLEANQYPDIEVDPTPIIVNATPPKIKSQDIFKKNIQFTPLETTDESLFGQIDEFIITESRYIIADRSTNAILVFFHNGKFDFKIERSGGGPKEYQSIKYIGYNKFKNAIEVLDNTRGIIQRYDANNGAYQSSLKLGFLIKAFTSLSENKYLFFLGPYLFNEDRYGQVEGLQHQLLVAQEIEENTVKIISQHIPHIPNTGFLNQGARQNLTIGSNNDFLINMVFNDTIYSFSEKGVNPKYVINYGKRSIPKDLFQEGSRREIERKKKLRQLPFPDIFWETDNYTYTVSSLETQRAFTHTLYDKNLKKSFSFGDNDGMQLVGALAYSPIGYQDNSLIYVMEPKDAVDQYAKITTALRKALVAEEEKNKTGEDIDKKHATFIANYIAENGFNYLDLAKSLDANDNPILVFVEPNFDTLND